MFNQPVMANHTGPPQTMVYSVPDMGATITTEAPFTFEFRSMEVISNKDPIAFMASAQTSINNDNYIDIINYPVVQISYAEGANFNNSYTILKPPKLTYIENSFNYSQLGYSMWN